MTTARRAAIALHVLAYVAAIYAAVHAADDGHDLYAHALFAASAALLVGIHREYRHAARQVRIVRVYRHLHLPAVDDGAAIGYATAFPLGCRCETWWTSLGTGHDPICPAHAREESP